MKDHYCRNCHFRFIPAFWDVIGTSLVAKCPNCNSNVTEEVDETKVYPVYDGPKIIYGYYTHYPCMTYE